MRLDVKNTVQHSCNEPLLLPNFYLIWPVKLYLLITGCDCRRRLHTFWELFQTRIILIIGSGSQDFFSFYIFTNQMFQYQIIHCATNCTKSVIFIFCDSCWPPLFLRNDGVGFEVGVTFKSIVLLSHGHLVAQTRSRAQYCWLSHNTKSIH